MIHQFYLSAIQVAPLIDSQGASDLEGEYTLFTQTNQWTRDRMFSLVQRAVSQQHIPLLNLLYKEARSVEHAAAATTTPILDMDLFGDALKQGMQITYRITENRSTLMECANHLPAVDDWIIHHCEDICGEHAETRSEDLQFLTMLFRALQADPSLSSILRSHNVIWTTVLVENSNLDFALDFMARVRAIPSLWECLYRDDVAFIHYILREHGKPTLAQLRAAMRHLGGFTFENLPPLWKACYLECVAEATEEEERLEDAKDLEMIAARQEQVNDAQRRHEEMLEFFHKTGMLAIAPHQLPSSSLTTSKISSGPEPQVLLSWLPDQRGEMMIKQEYSRKEETEADSHSEHRPILCLGSQQQQSSSCSSLLPLSVEYPANSQSAPRKRKHRACVVQ